MRISALLVLAWLFPTLSTALDTNAPGSRIASSLTTGNENRTSLVKETTIGCVPTPLPTAPIGPQWTYRLTESFPVGSAQSWNVTFWRVPCQDPGDAQLLLTATEGTFFCFHPVGQLSVFGRRAVFDANPNNSSIDPPICANVPSSAVVSADDFVFDDDGDVRFGWWGFPYVANHPDNFGFNIPPYDPAAYNTDLQLSGKLSGTYYDPNRNGEGVSVEVGRVGDRRLVFIAWYTYSGGVQQWMAGNADFPVGAREATIPLVVTTGGQFGPLFNPNQVSVTSWGNVTIRFPTCTTMQFRWSANLGGSGVYNYQRLTEGLEGISCP